MRPVYRQHVIQSFQTGRVQFGHLYADIFGTVGTHDAGAARIGDNRQMIFFDHIIIGQHAGGGKQFSDAISPNHTGPGNGGIKDIVAAHHRAGMRHGGFATGFMAA